MPNSPAPTPNTPTPDSEAFPIKPELVRSLKSRADEKRTFPERLADTMVRIAGSIGFLIANIIWFVGWIVWNGGFIPALTPFDPFPFQLLTMAVSLEAILLAVFVLISQNREERIAHLRQETDLQIDILVEAELTKMMKMLALLLEKNGIETSSDGDLQQMLQQTNVDKIEEILEYQISQH